MYRDTQDNSGKETTADPSKEKGFLAYMMM